jgi:hypothetical protein
VVKRAKDVFVARNYDHLLPNLAKANAARAQLRARMTKAQRRAETAAASKARDAFWARVKKALAGEKAAREGGELEG